MNKNKYLVQEEIFKLVLKTSLTQMSQKCHYSLYKCIKLEVNFLLFLSVKETLR
jgi:hypothetical protein